MTKKKSVSHITEMRNELFTGVVDNMGLKGDLYRLTFYCIINVREYRRDKIDNTIQRNWQHRANKPKKNKIKAQHNICWTPLCTTEHT